MANELCDTVQMRSCKGLMQLHLLSVSAVLLTAACAASVPQEKPCFHSQSTPLLLPPLPSHPSLPSSSCFPSNRHTDSVHYYSPGSTKTRIIALLSTTVSGEAGGGEEDRGKEKKGKAKDILGRKKNISPLCFLCPNVCTNIYYQTAACMSCSPFRL